MSHGNPSQTGTQRCPRLFCIGRNYAAHIRELGNAPDSACTVFMKPASALLAPGAPIRLPVGRGPVHHEAELVVRIGTGGRNIPADAALGHIDAFGLGLDLTLRAVQDDLKARGLPWELAKAFDGSAPLGPLVPRRDEDFRAFRFQLRVNGSLRQQGDTAQMLYGVADIVRILSSHWTLQPGDLIYTGTPAGVAPLAAGDTVELESGPTGRVTWEVIDEC